MSLFELTPVLRQRFFDSNGLPLVGGKLYSYVAGSSTPQATYTDSTGATPNANPVILDAAGSANVWMDESLNYKFVLNDINDVTQWSVDQVKGIEKLISDAINVAGALAIINNLSDLNNATAALQNLGIAPFSFPTRFSFTNGQSAANLSGETWDGRTYSSLVYEYEILQNIVGYLFVVNSANITIGATYTNNGHTYTVNSLISSGILLFTGTGTPQASGTLTKSSGTGDATITFTAAQPLYQIVGNGSFQVQFQNGAWILVKRADYDSGQPHGCAFGLATQVGAIGQLTLAETGGLGNGTLKLKKHYFFA
jgi:hypothetical protein